MPLSTKFTAPHFSTHWSAIAGLGSSGKDLPVWAQSMVIETWDSDPNGCLLVGITPVLTAWTYLGPADNSWPAGVPDNQYVLRDNENNLRNFAAKVGKSIHDVSLRIEKLEVSDPVNQLGGFDWWTITATSDTSSVSVKAIRNETLVGWRNVMRIAEIMTEEQPTLSVSMIKHPMSTLKAITKVKAPWVITNVSAPGRPTSVEWRDHDDRILARGVAYNEALRAPVQLDGETMDLFREAEKFLHLLQPEDRSLDEKDPDPEVERPQLAVVSDPDEPGESWGDQVAPDA